MTTLSLTIHDPSILVISGENLAVEVRAISPEAAHETRGGTGDDCSVGKRGVWPPQGGESSTRELNVTSFERGVTAGETAPISPSAPADAVTVPQAPTVTAPHSHQQPTDSPEADTAGEVAPPPTSPADPINPNCAHPDTCALARSMASCSACANAAAKARVAA